MVPVCKETASYCAEVQPALQGEYLTANASNVSQRLLNAAGESTFHVYFLHYRRCKFLSWDFSAVSKPIYLPCKIISPIKNLVSYMVRADRDRP